MQQQDLGFEKEQMLILRMNSDDLGNRFQVIKNELQQNAFVKSITASNVVPGQTFGNNLIVLEKDRSKKTNVFLGRLDEAFFETYNIPLLAGRNFNTSVPADSTGDNVIINEAALPFFGWKTPEEALGATFGGGWGTVIGVMKDFHYTSLQTKIEPLLTWYSDRRLIYFTIKMNTNNYQAAMSQLQAQWKELVPEMPFDYFFLDESFDTQYRSELRLSQLFTYFSVLAIFIACLGLLGLSAYVAERRTKEIGIRKVLGASTSSILLLLSKDFMLRIGIAFLIAIPIALYAMNQWLTDFAYRINLQWWMFALAGVLALAIALFTISFQAMRAASANPVESLKTE
ncbi:MAG: FtsX-like permease family protein [Saprospiraceae bacterium]|nr:FtsX-like permease family protein [Saprospiraceae bacterium]